MKVFVVFSGRDEESQAVGVFSTRAKAEALGTGDVEEFELDEGQERRWVPQYVARLRLADGSVIHRSNIGPDEVKEGDREKSWVNEAYGEAWACSSVSIDRALNLAAEKRQEWLRTRDLRPAFGPGGP